MNSHGLGQYKAVWCTQLINICRHIEFYYAMANSTYIHTSSPAAHHFLPCRPPLPPLPPTTSSSPPLCSLTTIPAAAALPDRHTCQHKHIRTWPMLLHICLLTQSAAGGRGVCVWGRGESARKMEGLHTVKAALERYYIKRYCVLTDGR